MAYRRRLGGVAAFVLALTLFLFPLDASADSSYTVKGGDTLWQIALDHGFDHWQPIFDANRDQLSNPNHLTIGLVLTIPDGAEGETAPTATPAPQPPPPPTTGTAERCGYDSSWITDTIIAAAATYGQSACAMLNVAWCESRFNPNAYNGQYGATGLFQFLYGTWLSTPFAGYSRTNAWASANAAGWMWAHGRRGEWVC